MKGASAARVWRAERGRIPLKTIRGVSAVSYTHRNRNGISVEIVFSYSSNFFSLASERAIEFNCSVWAVSLSEVDWNSIFSGFRFGFNAAHVHVPVFSPLANQFSQPIAPEQTRRDSECAQTLHRCEAKNSLVKILCVKTKAPLPFSKLSICSFVNDVRFRCNFRFNRRRNWLSSSPDELPPFSELPSDVLSCELACEGVWCRPSAVNKSAFDRK